MKTLTLILVLLLTFNLTAQQSCDTIKYTLTYRPYYYNEKVYALIKPVKICFPRERQAKRQVNRLNVYHTTQVWNEKDNCWNIAKKRYCECEEGFCVEIECGDADRSDGWMGMRSVIRKKHYKYILKKESIGFGVQDCWLKYTPSKFQKFIKKIKPKIKHE